MFSLGASEMHCKGLKTNAGLTVFRKAWNAETKVGLNEPWYPIVEGPSCQTSYPGGNSTRNYYFFVEITQLQNYLEKVNFNFT